MTLIKRLAARKAAFYFVERDWVAYDGSQALIALAARWLKPYGPFPPVPEVLPIWMGSYLPFPAAMQRWAFPDVFVVILGFPDAGRRGQFVAHARENPPLGMFDTDADADDLTLPLALDGFVLPNAAIQLEYRGRRVDRNTGLDIIGCDNDEEETALRLASEATEDVLSDALLLTLIRNAGRHLRGARISDGFEALVDQAFELLAFGALGAAGAVAGVAFEQLMRAALTGEDRAWLKEREANGHASLNDIIGKVASANGGEDKRLRRYQWLRNDLAHRLGDESDAQRDDEELVAAVEDFLHWLDLQEVTGEDAATLTELQLAEPLSYDDLFTAARADGDAAAVAAQTTPVTIEDEVFEPVGFAWVTVRDPRRPFTRWLLASGNANQVQGGAQFFSPERSFERNLAWAHACAMRLRQAGLPADYAGRLD